LGSTEVSGAVAVGSLEGGSGKIVIRAVSFFGPEGGSGGVGPCAPLPTGRPMPTVSFLGSGESAIGRCESA
jgi:hypothetical protein